MIPAKHYKKIDKNSSLNNRRVDSSEDGFKNFSIYLDTVNIKSEMTNLGLEKYETLLLNAMNKAIETLQSLLKVKELSEDFLFSDDDMAQLQIPYWDKTKLGSSATNGIKSLGLDLTIMGYFEDFQDDSILAAAQPAIIDPGTNRPIIGIVAINPKVDYSKLNSEKAFQTIFLHEFTHILGFVPETFQDLDFLGTETNNGITRHYLKSSKVVEVAKKYFNCNNLKGAYLEESDEEDGYVSSHWEARTLLGEYMNAVTYQEEEVISEFTLAYLEDTGFYKPNYYTGGLMRHGKGKGCDFLQKKCVISQEVNSLFKNEFFSSVLSDTNYDASCSSGRLSRAYHYFTYYSEIPSAFQYFDDSSKGGFTSADYCPVSRGILNESDISHYVGSCNTKGTGEYGMRILYHAQEYIKNKTHTTTRHFTYYNKSGDIVDITGESLSEQSFCYQSTLLKDGLVFNNTIPRAVCYESFCSNRSLTIKINDDYFVCPRAGGKIAVEGYSGYFLCPDYNLICSGTVMCNDLFECVEKKSETKEESYNYDYTIATNQNLKDAATTKFDNTTNYELSENGICPKDCKQCQENNKCSICRDNYVLLGSEESEEIICIEKDTVKTGYYQENGIYYPCIEDCEVCNSGTSCQECSTDFVLVDSICVGKIDNCAEYNSTDKTCAKCNDNYAFKENDRLNCTQLSTFESYYTKDNGISYYPCGGEIENCEKCYYDEEKSEAKCYLCSSEYLLSYTLDGEKERCFSKDDLGEYECKYNDTHTLKCSNAIINCEEYENLTSCAKCANNFYMIDDDKKKCENGDNYTNSQQYFPNGDNTMLYSCSNYNDISNCKLCSEKTSCTFCQDGYTFINSDKSQCIQIDTLNNKYVVDPNDGSQYTECKNVYDGCDTCNNEQCLTCLDEYAFMNEDYSKCILKSLIPTTTPTTIPTTIAPTTNAPTTIPPTTVPTTIAPTTSAPTTIPTTIAPTTTAPTTIAPTTTAPTTIAPTTTAPTTIPPTTTAPTTIAPTTTAPTTIPPTTTAPTTIPPTTTAPTTILPTTIAPTTIPPTTTAPTTIAPTTTAPTTIAPTTTAPTTIPPTTTAPTTIPPTTTAPTTIAPTTTAPTTISQTTAPTTIPPTTSAPTTAPTTIAATTSAPTTAPTTIAPTTTAPTTISQTTAPTTIAPTTSSPTTITPTTAPTTIAPTTIPTTTAPTTIPITTAATANATTSDKKEEEAAEKIANLTLSFYQIYNFNNDKSKKTITFDLSVLTSEGEINSGDVIHALVNLIHSNGTRDSSPTESKCTLKNTKSSSGSVKAVFACTINNIEGDYYSLRYNTSLNISGVPNDEILLDPVLTAKYKTVDENKIIPSFTCESIKYDSCETTGVFTITGTLSAKLDKSIKFNLPLTYPKGITTSCELNEAQTEIKCKVDREIDDKEIIIEQTVIKQGTDDYFNLKSIISDEELTCLNGALQDSFKKEDIPISFRQVSHFEKSANGFSFYLIILAAEKLNKGKNITINVNDNEGEKPINCILEDSVNSQAQGKFLCSVDKTKNAEWKNTNMNNISISISPNNDMISGVSDLDETTSNPAKTDEKIAKSKEKSDKNEAFNPLEDIIDYYSDEVEVNTLTLEDINMEKCNTSGILTLTGTFSNDIEESVNFDLPLTYPSAEIKCELNSVQKNVKTDIKCKTKSEISSMQNIIIESRMIKKRNKELFNFQAKTFNLSEETTCENYDTIKKQLIAKRQTTGIFFGFIGKISLIDQIIKFFMVLTRKSSKIEFEDPYTFISQFKFSTRRYLRTLDEVTYSDIEINCDLNNSLTLDLTGGYNCASEKDNYKGTPKSLEVDSELEEGISGIEKINSPTNSTLDYSNKNNLQKIDNLPIITIDGINGDTCSDDGQFNITGTISDVSNLKDSYTDVEITLSSPESTGLCEVEIDKSDKSIIMTCQNADKFDMSQIIIDRSLIQDSDGNYIFVLDSYTSAEQFACEISPNSVKITDSSSTDNSDSTSSDSTSDTDSKKSDESEGNNFSRSKKSSGGLSGGAIAAIAVACVVAVAVIGVLIALIKNGTLFARGNKQIIDQTSMSGNLKTDMSNLA